MELTVISHRRQKEPERMRSERKAAVLGNRESIEMELFSSEECCVVIPAQEKLEEYRYNQLTSSSSLSTTKRHLEHPLVPDCEEEPELEVETRPRQRAVTKTERPVKEVKQRHSNQEIMEEIEIEMEVFPPFRVSYSERVEPFVSKISQLKWKRLTPQMTGLVVKDVVCLPRGNLAQPERHVVPHGKQRAALATMGLTARITIDCGWSANQVQNRLALLFRGLFVKAGQRFTFTYLECLQGYRVLFVPDSPAEGWTGEQVLRITRDGTLYILSHHDYPQRISETLVCATPVVNRKNYCLEDRTERSLDEDKQLQRLTQPPVGSTTEEELRLDLDTALRQLTQEKVDGVGETHIHVKRKELLHSALEVVRRLDFSFRTTPIISFSGEETDGNEGPIREFFRLTLLELQESSVFEGYPGRVFLTYDLKALEDRKYYEAGVLIGWSLAQGGPGPRCLHPTLYQLMCGQNPSLDDFSWNEIVDAEAQIRLKQLHGCADVKLLSLSLCDWVSSRGIPGIYSDHSDEIPAIYSCLVKHYIYHRVASMISQFKEGMNSCGGLWDMVQSHWEEFVPVMTSTKQQLLTLEVFKKLFTVCYSHPDSHLRAAEEATAGHWESLLNLISNGEADFSFGDLLAFVTGADHLPLLGFPRLISLQFYSQDASMSGVRLPFTSTCALELFLPRGVEGVVDLLMLLSRAVKEALGFTHVETEGAGDDSCI